MKRLSDFSADRLRLTRDDFLARHPVPVLLHRYDATAEEGDGSLSTSYASMLDLPHKVVDVSRLTDPLAALGLTGRGSTSLDVAVFPIVKRSGAVFHDRVSVGRNRNADIHLPFRKISKFHAYFTQAPGGSRVMITDAGSTNGTFVGGRRLPTGQPVEVAEKSVILFGQFLFVFFTAAGFYSLISGE